MDIGEKALYVINYLTADDLCEEISMQLARHEEHGTELKLSQEDLEILFRKIISIFKIAHSADKSCVCWKVHDNWRKRTLGLYRKFKKRNTAPIGGHKDA